MKKAILLSVSILLISLAYSFAEVPCKINYQGRLIKDNVPVDGTKKMRFSIHDSATGGNELWASGDVNVTVHNGLFRYVIGSDGGDLSSIDWTAGQELYLEVEVETEILTPREELYSYPYAINSHLLEGKTKEYFINTSGDAQTKQGNLNIMGNLGIGTTGPSNKLDVAGSIRSVGGTISAELASDVGGNVAFVNPNKTGATTRDWRIFNMTGSYGNALKFWRYYADGTNAGPSVTFWDNGNVQMTNNLTVAGNVGIGTTSPQAKLDVNGEIKCSGFADHFGMNWHEAVAEKYNLVGWATAVDYSGSGVLLYVQAYGRWVEPLNNRLRITIDGEVWRNYTGLAKTVGANGWNILDDSSDQNSCVITLMPFKKFSSSLRVEIYNAYSSSESSVRVNYLTP